MDNLISRQAAIDSIKETSPAFFSAYKHYIYIDKQDAIARLIALPSVQPELKKGKWVKNEFYENALQCSNCHAYLDKEDWSRHYFYFCYHCGAFMEGMETEE